jgi:hypothetical protein
MQFFTHRSQQTRVKAHLPTRCLTSALFSWQMYSYGSTGGIDPDLRGTGGSAGPTSCRFTG